MACDKRDGTGCPTTAVRNTYRWCVYVFTYMCICLISARIRVNPLAAMDGRLTRRPAAPRDNFDSVLALQCE